MNNSFPVVLVDKKKLKEEFAIFATDIKETVYIVTYIHIYGLNNSLYQFQILGWFSFYYHFENSIIINTSFNHSAI